MRSMFGMLSQKFANENASEYGETLQKIRKDLYLVLEGSSSQNLSDTKYDQLFSIVVLITDTLNDGETFLKWAAKQKNENRRID